LSRSTLLPIRSTLLLIRSTLLTFNEVDRVEFNVVADVYRSLRLYGRCPVTLESPASWYWNAVEGASTGLYVIQSGIVPAFKLYSSNVVYLHCNLELCLVGEECPLKTEVALRHFLPRDAMPARPMPSCGVRPSVCLFVCPSVSPSRSCILSKRINISSNFFTVG